MLLTQHFTAKTYGTNHHKPAWKYTAVAKTPLIGFIAAISKAVSERLVDAIGEMVLSNTEYLQKKNKRSGGDLQDTDVLLVEPRVVI